MNNIILYSTGCVKCKELKSLLDKNNITYTINTSVDEMIALGFDKVPMLSVDGEHMDFNASKKWIDSLKK